MKIKNGFTLIELLAVIVILAIIALIAVPIVLNIVNDSKESSNKESVNLYLDHVQKAIVKKQMKDVSFNPSSCTIKAKGYLECGTTEPKIEVEVEMNGEVPNEGTLYFNDGKISVGENILLNGLYYQVENGTISKVTKDKISGTELVMSKIKAAVGSVTNTCEIISENRIKCGSNESSISNIGIKKVLSGTITFENGEVKSYRNLNIDGTYYHKTDGQPESTSSTPRYAYLLNDVAPTGLSVGDKYSYQVNDTATFNFYVLSTEGIGDNQKVNLIMDRNICEDGSVNYTSTNNYCRYAWHGGSNDNNYGPDTIMTVLYNATKEWKNVPDMVMNYTDENNTGNDTLGYTSIITNASTKVTTITGKQSKTSTAQTIGDSSKPLKARLPKESEVTATGVGCTTSNGSCPVWLMENMAYYNVNNDKYSMNNNSEAYQNIYGYWLLSSYPGDSNRARIVYYRGYLGYGYAGDTGNYGPRPVITVSNSDLSS